MRAECISFLAALHDAQIVLPPHSKAMGLQAMIFLRRIADEWPDVPRLVHIILLMLPVLTLIVIVLWLRVLWPVKNKVAAAQAKPVPDSKGGASITEDSLLILASSDTVSNTYSSVENGEASRTVNSDNVHDADADTVKASSVSSNEGAPFSESTLTLIEAGQVAGDYSRDWKGTFDMVLLVASVCWLLANVVVTWWVKPSLFNATEFWLTQVPRVLSMTLISVLAGLLCRRFCPVDSDGYIITSRKSWFKVNYTRKIQHFGAYMMPLLFSPSEACHCRGTLELSWSVWFTLLGFVVMIKPVRERIPFFMLQFNALDRPEDRPHTLKWILLYNIWPGELLLVLFTRLFAASHHNLLYIMVFVTGIGDGLAEPVGISFGSHKYLVPSLRGGAQYQRSMEGSACVFLSAVWTVVLVYASFDNYIQFGVALLTLPIALTLAEAFSPHTMDTPFIMGVGGLLTLFIVSYL